MGTQPASPSHGGRQRRYTTGVLVRCTPAEKKEIYARARRANRSASRFLVELGIGENGGAAVERPPPQELAVLEGLMVQLRRVATTLNDLARREHASDHAGIDPPTDAEFRQAATGVKELLDQLRSRLT